MEKGLGAHGSTPGVCKEMKADPPPHRGLNKERPSQSSSRKNSDQTQGTLARDACWRTGTGKLDYELFAGRDQVCDPPA